MTQSQERLPPSATSYAIATVILVFVGGYFLGQGISLGLFTRSSTGTKKESWPNSYNVKVYADSSDEQGADSSSDDEEEEGEQGELKNFDETNEECKLVLVVRTDLGMTKGSSFAFHLLSFAPPYLPPSLQPTSHLPPFLPSLP